MSSESAVIYVLYTVNNFIPWKRLEMVVGHHFLEAVTAEKHTPLAHYNEFKHRKSNAQLLSGLQRFILHSLCFVMEGVLQRSIRQKTFRGRDPCCTP